MESPDNISMEEKQMDEAFGVDHADFQMKVVSVTSKEEANSLITEILAFNGGLTDAGKDDLIIDLERLWKI